MKKSKNLFIKILFVLIMASCPMQASAQASGKVVNEGRAGAVDISLEYAMDAPTGAVLPNQTVGLKSTVMNKAEPAWVRAKIQYPVYANEATLSHLAEENLTELDDNLITFESPDWKKIGEYYYLTYPVGTGEAVKFTKSIRFPADWDNRMVSSKFGISITAEAIQEKNFKPDFASEDPWFGAVIESYDTTDYRERGCGTDRFSIHFEDGAENMVKAGDNFFGNWDYVMPGDTLTGEAQIKNNMRRPVRLHFGIEPGKGDKGILKLLHIKIMHGDDVVYDGDLAKGMDEKFLEEYASGMEGKLSYTLTAPSAMDNAYAEKLFQTVWTLRAEIVPEEPVHIPQENPVERIIDVVKTGDAAFLLRMAACGLMLMASAGAGIYFVRGRRRKK